MDRICIFHPQGKHKTGDDDPLQGFVDGVLKTAKKANQKSPKNKRMTSPKLIRKPTTSILGWV
jgi:hypothetical protein